MAWEEELFAVLDELEQQADALYAADRLAELEDRSRAEYQQVTLASRLMATLDRPVTLHVAGVGAVSGVLERVAAGWCLVSGQAAAQGADWIVLLAAVSAVEGATARAVPDVAWPVTARLGPASALRRLAAAGERCVLLARDGSRREGTIGRVGADFVEVEEGMDARRRVVLVALDQLAAVQSRPA